MSNTCKALVLNTESVSIFVDGSYHPECQIASYAFAAFEASNRVIIYQESGPLFNKPFLKIQSTAAELLATLKAVQWAQKKGYKNINIFYDFSGIKALTKHQFKGHRHPLFSLYKEYLTKFTQPNNNQRVYFHKVKSHSGILGNEMVDRMAWTAILNAWRAQKSNPWPFLAKKWYSIFSNSIISLCLKTKIYRIPKEEPLLHHKLKYCK